jgi:hypothetical protein
MADLTALMSAAHRRKRVQDELVALEQQVDAIVHQ